MIKTKLAYIFIDEFGFCRIRLDSSEHEVMGNEEALELCEAITKVCDGTKRKLLTDSRGVQGHVGLEAREIIRNHPGMLEFRVAEAFVVDNLPTRLIANFYLKFNRPPNPTRIFNSLESAEEWLNGLDLDQKIA